MHDFYTIQDIAAGTGKALQTIRAAIRGEGSGGILQCVEIDGIRYVRKGVFHAFRWAERGRHGAQRTYRYDINFEKVYD